MPTLSIEILLPRAGFKPSTPPPEGLSVDASFPAVSDRSPSIWQNHIDAQGGELFHLFDTPIKEGYRRWAYNIVEDCEWKSFRFREKYWPYVIKFMTDALLVNKSLWLYTDAQWSNNPKIIQPQLSLPEFIKLHDANRIRFNTAINIVI